MEANSNIPDLSSIAQQEHDNIETPNIEDASADELPVLGDRRFGESPSQSINPERESELRIILSLYYHKFKEDLAVLQNDLNGDQLSNKNLYELEELRKKCDLILGASSACENKKKFFNSMIYFIESMGNKAGLKLDGLTATLVSDADFQRDLCRLSLKYLSSKETLPEITVGMRLMTTITQINFNNEQRGAIVVSTTPQQGQTTSNVINTPRQSLQSKQTLMDNINKNFSDL